MRTLRVTDKAEDDLVKIVIGISNFSHRAARRLQASVSESYDQLLENPFSGPACDRIKMGWRFVSVDGTYLIFYRVTDDFIDILHVVHGVRNLVDLYAEED